MPADSGPLAELERLCPETGIVTARLQWQGDYFALDRRYPEVRCWVAEDPYGRVVGTVSSSEMEVGWDTGEVRGCYLFRLRVRPDLRRRGLASFLMQHAMADAESRGAQVFWGFVIPGNKASLRLCQKVGFRAVARSGLLVTPVPIIGALGIHLPGTLTGLAGPLAGEARSLLASCFQDCWLRPRHGTYAPAPKDPDDPPGSESGTYGLLSQDGSIRAMAEVVSLGEHCTVHVEGGSPPLLAILKAASRLGVAPDPSRPWRVALVHGLAYPRGRHLRGAILLYKLAAKLRDKADVMVVTLPTSHWVQWSARLVPGLWGGLSLMVRSPTPPPREVCYYVGPL